MSGAGAGRLAVLACLVLGTVTAGCTAAREPDAAAPPSPPTTSADVDPAPSPRATPRGVPEATTEGATEGATGGSTEGSTEPLVLVRHATLPRPTFGEARALRVRARLERRDADDAGGLRRVLRRPGAFALLPAGSVDARVRTAVVGGVDPLRDPASYPWQVPSAAAPPGPVTLTVGGDVMLSRRVADPAAALAPLRDRLRGADLTVANLESTLSRAGPPTQGGDSFAADPRIVGLLERTGFDAVSLANNHAGDFGTRALVETVDRLRRSEVVPFGAGRDLSGALRPAVLRRGGVAFGLLGFNAIGETPAATPSSPGALSVRMPPRTGPLARDDLEEVLRAVRRLRRRVDVVVVLPHWGTQYTHRPEPVQRRVGRALIGAGADLVVGGHPHWVQGLEWHRGRLLAHSLGNLVFDMDFMTQTQQGVLLEAVFWGPELKGVELVPYRMDPAFAPRPASRREGREILRDVWGASTGPFSLSGPAGPATPGRSARSG